MTQKRKRTTRRGDMGLLLRLIDQGFDHQAWHGPTLAGALRGVTWRQALWRPHQARHNVWELTLHTAYWKYAVRRRLVGGPQGAFPRAGSNWPELPKSPGERAWKADVALLKSEHRTLRETIAALPAAVLGKRGGRGRWTNAEMIHGVAMHDLYHAGQVQLLLRLRAGV